MSSDHPAERYPEPLSLFRSAARALAYAAPIAVVVALFVTYRVDSAFYLDYIIQIDRRETQALEIATFVFALLGALSLVPAWRLARHGGYGLGAAAIAIIGLASFFFAGEEISWGQSYFGWETPAAYKEYSVETNLHNNHLLPVRTLAGLFTLVVFFAFPLAWRLRRRLRLPASLGPAVPDGPVVFTVIVAVVWRQLKRIYQISVPDWEKQPFYIDFVEQINEHKELLVAMALAMYTLYRLGAVRRALGEDGGYREAVPRRSRG